MTIEALRIAFVGLSITSSWGNGHASTYRGLVKELTRRGHEVAFLERDVPWYAGEHRDFAQFPYGGVFLYDSLEELRARYHGLIRDADAVVLGSYVPDGIEVARWVNEAAGGLRIFYDIDTPETIAGLRRGDCAYLDRQLVATFDLYLSFSSGPLLRQIETEFGARRAAALYCSVDPDLYFPEEAPPRWDLGYLGTYSADRQPKLDTLLIEPARRMPQARFVVAGPQYPASMQWPQNVERIEHIPPDRHRAFYNAQRYTLNITRANMVTAGWAPSVRLFEAAACATPIISDVWDGLDRLLRPGAEILLASTAEDVTSALAAIAEERRLSIGHAARRRILAEHTAECRARELEALITRLAVARRPARKRAQAFLDPHTADAH